MNIEHVTSNVPLYKSSFYYNQDKYKSIINTKNTRENTNDKMLPDTTKNSAINDYVYDPKTSRKGLQWLHLF